MNQLISVCGYSIWLPQYLHLVVAVYNWTLVNINAALFRDEHNTASAEYDLFVKYLSFTAKTIFVGQNLNYKLFIIGSQNGEMGACDLAVLN